MCAHPSSNNDLRANFDARQRFFDADGSDVYVTWSIGLHAVVFLKGSSAGDLKQVEFTICYLSNFEQQSLI
jgi:hypothetical protein